MVKKNNIIFKILLFAFLFLIFQSYSIYANNNSKEIIVKLLQDIALNKNYKNNILKLLDLEKNGYHNAEIYLLLAYNYTQIGQKSIALIFLRKGLYYNKANKLILKYIKFLEPDYYEDIIYFPFIININLIIILILFFSSNFIIFLLIIINKKKLLNFFILISLLLFLMGTFNIIYPYFDKSAFTINQTNIYKYPTPNSPIITNVNSATPLKIKLIGRNFIYVNLTNGVNGWIFKKDIKKVFYDK